MSQLKSFEETERQELAAANDGPKYPRCVVTLIGEDGNAFAVMGAVKKALKVYLREDGYQASAINQKIEEFLNEAMSGDYNHLLRVCMEWVTVE